MSGIVEINPLRDLKEAADDVRRLSRILADPKLPAGFNSVHRTSVEAMLQIAKGRQSRAHALLQLSRDLGTLHLRKRARVFPLTSRGADRVERIPIRSLKCEYDSLIDSWTYPGGRIDELFIDVKPDNRPAHLLVVCVADIDLSRTAWRTSLPPPC